MKKTGIVGDMFPMEDRHVPDTWERGDLYERYIGRWSRMIAPLFLSWMDCAARQRWLDAGCGTGALSAAIAEQCSPKFATGIDLSAGFLQAARENLAGQAGFARASATSIPLATGSIDVLVSGLMLNFVADSRAAVIEMARVIRPGGLLGAYVWDYAGKMEFLSYFWDAAAALDPGAGKLDEGIRFPLCDPLALKDLFGSAGLVGIETGAIELEMRFASFEDYWSPFLGGQGPAPAYVMALGKEERARLRDRLQERIPARADGSFVLAARVWAIRGINPVR